MKNIPNCCARTHGGRNACKNPGTYMEPVSTKGSNAWARDAKKHASEGLLGKDIPVCGTHRNQLKAGKAIAFYSKVVQEPEQLVLDVPEATEKVITPSEGRAIVDKIHGNKTAFCGHCKIRHEAYRIKACYMAAGKIRRQES
jgi:hypothetical protein